MNLELTNVHDMVFKFQFYFFPYGEFSCACTSLDQITVDSISLILEVLISGSV